jgi:hypothetical protein
VCGESGSAGTLPLPRAREWGDTSRDNCINDRGKLWSGCKRGRICPASVALRLRPSLPHEKQHLILAALTMRFESGGRDVKRSNAHKDCAPNILLQFKRRVFRSSVPPLMAGTNLGMSERNDTMAAHRSVVAVRNSNWAENKINRPTAGSDRQKPGRVCVEHARRDSGRRPTRAAAAR